MNSKILVDCERLKYPKSGLANVCRSLIVGFEEIKPNFNITLYGITTNFPQNSFGFLKWNSFHRIFPPNLQNFDLVHVTHQLSGYFHKIKSNQKKIVTLHDLNFLRENLPDHKLKKRIALVQKNIGNADAIACISDFARQDFIKNQHLFSLKPKILVERIYNGLMFPEQKNYTSERYDYLKTKKYLLNIGVLFPKKNQLVLLDFLAKTDLDLVVVSASSKPGYLAQFNAKIKELNPANRVHILNDVDENEKNFLLQNCVSYVHPSLAEGFGIPPIEAMYFGKPVFLSTATSLPEIGGNLAFYFENFKPEKMAETFNEKMKFFNENFEDYQLKLRNHALQFSAEKMASEYAELYKKVLN